VRRKREREETKGRKKTSGYRGDFLHRPIAVQKG